MRPTKLVLGACWVSAPTRVQQEAWLPAPAISFVQPPRVDHLDSISLFKLNNKQCPARDHFCLLVSAYCLQPFHLFMHVEKQRGWELSELSWKIHKMRAGCGGAMNSKPSACPLILSLSLTGRCMQGSSVCPLHPSTPGSPQEIQWKGFSFRHESLWHRYQKHLAAELCCHLHGRIFTFRHITSIMENA